MVNDTNSRKENVEVSQTPLSHPSDEDNDFDEVLKVISTQSPEASEELIVLCGNEYNAIGWLRRTWVDNEQAEKLVLRGEIPTVMQLAREDYGATNSYRV